MYKASHYSKYFREYKSEEQTVHARSVAYHLLG